MFDTIGSVQTSGSPSSLPSDRPTYRSADRPAVALINNSQTPYRLHFHLRLARELRGVTIHSVFTHGESNAAWTLADPPEINPIRFGDESSKLQDSPRQALREWAKAGRIIQWMKQTDIRAAVVGGYNDPGRLRIIRWCYRNRVPCFLFADSNVHGDKATGVKKLVKGTLLRWVVSRLAGVLPCGRLGAEYFLRYGARADRIFYMPYEPDYRLIQEMPESQIAQVKQQFGLKDGRRRIVFSGRLVGVKRADLLVEAFCQIAAERPEWDLVMVGDGPDRDALRAKVPAALTDRVIWCGFVDDQAVVSATYRASQVLCLPSSYEPWAVVVNEAAAAGLAIVCSDVVGAAAELLVDGKNGRFFRSGDVKDLTAALSFVTSADRYEQLAAASAEVLADWRRRGDPVDGLRKALASVDVIAAESDRPVLSADPRRAVAT